MAKKRTSLKKLKLSAFNMQKGRCFYCGKPMWHVSNSEFSKSKGITGKQALSYQCTGEHLVAHSEGGKANGTNIVAACKFCNAKRHARKIPMAPKQFRDYVRKRVAKGKWNCSLGV